MSVAAFYYLVKTKKLYQVTVSKVGQKLVLCLLRDHDRNKSSVCLLYVNVLFQAYSNPEMSWAGLVQPHYIFFYDMHYL